MAQNIRINGTTYDGRSDVSKYGTFFRQVQPPSYSSLGTEMSNNNGFESWITSSNCTKWGLDTNGNNNPTLSREAGIVHGGSFSAKLDFSPITNGNLFQFENDDQNQSLAGPANLTISVWIYGTAGKRVVLRALNNPTTSLYFEGTYTLQNSNTWEQASFTGTIPGGGGNFRWFCLRVLDYSASEIYYFDDASVKAGGTNGVQTMDCNWGSRLAEMSGRVRGLSGQFTLVANGTNSANATVNITFPAGYFNFIPCIDIRMLNHNIVIGYNNQILQGSFVSANWQFTRQQDPNLTYSHFIQMTFPIVQLFNLGSTGFTAIIYTPNTGQEIRTWTWHAYGV